MSPLILLSRHLRQIGAIISNIGVVLISLQFFFLPFDDYTVIGKPGHAGTGIHNLQEAIADANSTDFHRRFETDYIIGVILTVLPYLCVSIILIFNCFSLYKPLSRIYRRLYFGLLIPPGLIFTLILLLPGGLFGMLVRPLSGYWAMMIGLICLCIGYGIVAQSSIHGSPRKQE